MSKGRATKVYPQEWIDIAHLPGGRIYTSTALWAIPGWMRVSDPNFHHSLAIASRELAQVTRLEPPNINKSLHKARDRTSTHMPCLSLLCGSKATPQGACMCVHTCLCVHACSPMSASSPKQDTYIPYKPLCLFLCRLHYSYSTSKRYLLKDHLLHKVD